MGFTSGLCGLLATDRDRFCKFLIDLKFTFVNFTASTDH